MLKKLLSILIAASFLNVPAAFAEFSEYDNSEEINYNVRILEEKQFGTSKQKFVKLDLSSYANRGFKDETAGDKTGGWADQGENDMRFFKLYNDVTFLGVPFFIIDPATNNGKSVLGIKGQNDPELPRKVEIPIDGYYSGAYFLHSAPYGKPNQLCGRYRFVYEDGSSAYLDIIRDLYVNNFWGNPQFLYSRSVWVGDNATAKANNSKINLSMFALNNPHPDKKIKSLVLETEGTGAYLMIVGITLTDSGPYMITLNGDYDANPATDAWREYSVRDAAKSKGTAIDVSYVLDAPAGKHGKTQTDGDRFVFADKTEAKFWGVNIVGKANFPDAQEAEAMAEELSQSGVNLVRMTELDGDFEGGIFADDGSTANISTAGMDKLCYFIKCLKDKGIYTYLTVTSKRAAKAGDGIENIGDTADGYKIEGFFDEKLISLQKDYLGKLLNYKNPYTGFKIGDDPAVAMLEFMDSNGMLMYSSLVRGEYGISSDGYYSELKNKFNAFISKKYKNKGALKSYWTSDYDSAHEQSSNNLDILPLWNSNLYSKQHLLDNAEFLAEIQSDYYDEMKNYVKSMGFDILTTCASNGINFFEYADLKANSNSDFIARNGINNAPGKYSDSDRSILDDSALGVTEKLLKSRISGKPYMVSEWNTSLSAPFTGDSALLMAAISAQQGWSACRYNYTDGSDSGTRLGNYYSVRSDATRAALMPATAILYNGLNRFDEKYTKMIDSENTFSHSSFDGVKFNRLYSERVGISFEGKSGTNVFAPGDAPKNDNFVFDKDDKIYQIRTDNTEAFVGILGDYETQKHIDVSIDNTFSAVALSALDNKTFADADRFLLTTVGRTRNDGMDIGEMNIILDYGGEKAVTEPVTGKIVLKLGRCRVYSLDYSGQRTAEIEVKYDSRGNASFVMDSGNSAPYYEIVRE